MKQEREIVLDEERNGEIVLKENGMFKKVQKGSKEISAYEGIEQQRLGIEKMKLKKQKEIDTLLEYDKQLKLMQDKNQEKVLNF